MTAPAPQANETGRLLVVDDVEANRDMLSRRLQRRGHDVAVAADGSEALRMIDEDAFDVVLLDIMMPGIDGLEVLRRVRAKLTTADLPIIMATAKEERESVVEALKLGANDYVTKPIDFPATNRINSAASVSRWTGCGGATSSCSTRAPKRVYRWP